VFPGLSPAIYDAAHKTGAAVVQYLHNYRFGCINGFLLNHGKPCSRCQNGNFIPAVVTNCWRDSRAASAIMGISLGRLRASGVLQEVAHWIAVSHAQKAVQVQFGIPAEKISVLHHFHNEPTQGASQSGRDVLFLGRLSPEKGVDLLIRAWQEADIRDRALVIVGDGPMLPMLQKLARPNSNIRFEGFLKGEALEQRWLQTAISVVPSIWEEPFGRIVLESWAHGVPVLAARIGALPELIGKGGAGWQFEPHSIGSLAAALRSVLSEESGLSTAAAQCHAALAKFSKEDWLAKINAIFESVKRRSAPRNICVGSNLPA
jgi:glycosyltransferase involved in cell wall biosynthesis